MSMPSLECKEVATFIRTIADLPSSNDITYLAQPLAQSVVEGETLVLECLATSSIAPDVRW